MGKLLGIGDDGGENDGGENDGGESDGGENDGGFFKVVDEMEERVAALAPQKRQEIIELIREASLTGKELRERQRRFRRGQSLWESENEKKESENE